MSSASRISQCFFNCVSQAFLHVMQGNRETVLRCYSIVECFIGNVTGRKGGDKDRAYAANENGTKASERNGRL